MRKKLFLHIGQTKTGSTSLQRFLHVNRAALAERGVLYAPGAAGEPADEASPLAPHNHRHLFTALQEARGGLDAAAPAWQAAARAIGEHPAPVAVISSELLWHLFVGRPALRRQALQWLARALAPFDVRIVCYLRPQDSWAEAMYNQLVKSGQTKAATLSFTEYLARPQTLGLMDYAQVIEPWAEAFGPGALIVRAFERANLVAGDVIDDFMALVGQDDLQGLVRLPDAQQRLSWPVCELLTAFNRHPGLKPQRDDFLRWAEANAKPDPRARLLDAQAVSGIRQRHAASNAVVARAYCGRETLFDAPAGQQAGAPPYTGLTTTEMAELLVTLFAQRLRPDSAGLRSGRGAGSARPGRPRCVPRPG
jgi:hypothetical protein